MILRLIAYTGIILLYCFFTTFAVGVGVLTALKTFWKTDMQNGFELVLSIITGIKMSKEKEEEENVDKTGRNDTDR